ncbi:DNA glycosylase [Aeromonas veronii]|uniref:very short patch repair endonuclease n=1 Tax=Aeromonas veronii TaxID=654 RepID=UPI0007188375|nr:very short patch repair endonuclease [Aeromonas veronii]KRV68237.1 DNA glycosylase [Aeromonas veronii]KRV79295.1 DNA glycosylase [Aeromonas veronii]KRV90899.1 DNA glycosylase [Aeromonas veronii]KRV92177.1 DNA glycosylase [Aeromonas veronii]
MPDIVNPETRSRLMAGIKNANTKPEIQIRQLLHHAGFRYRLHNAALPGKPDLWLARYRAVIEVNGCFWHGHDCHLFKLPSTRTDFWQTKIASNRSRDARHLAELEQLGIRRLTIWECALKGRLRHDPERLTLVISWWLTSGISHCEIAGGVELEFLA